MEYKYDLHCRPSVSAPSPVSLIEGDRMFGWGTATVGPRGLESGIREDAEGVEDGSTSREGLISAGNRGSLTLAASQPPPPRASRPPCPVQMAAESNRIKYIPGDRPIDDLRWWFLSGTCSANTTVVSFLSPRVPPTGPNNLRRGNCLSLSSFSVFLFFLISPTS